jgi:hypothetical protein
MLVKMEVGGYVSKALWENDSRDKSEVRING